MEAPRLIKLTDSLILNLNQITDYEWLSSPDDPDARTVTRILRVTMTSLQCVEFPVAPGEPAALVTVSRTFNLPEPAGRELWAVVETLCIPPEPIADLPRRSI